MVVRTEEANEYRKNFHNYYYNNILPALSKFELLRKQEYSKYKLWVGLSVLTVFVFIGLFIYYSQTLPPDVFWGSGSSRNGLFNLIIYGGFFICSGFLYIANRVKKQFERRVKKSVIKVFLSYFGDFHWNCDLCLDLFEILESRLIGSNERTEIKGDDYFWGTHKGLKFIISELKATVPGDKKRVQIFSGLFIKIDMNKKVNSHTVVFEDCSLKSLSGLTHLPLSFSGFSKTEMEDPEFNSMFDVYTTDEVEARYVLTTSFIERLKKLKQIYSAKEIRVSFNDNSMLLALKCNNDMFVMGDVRKPITDAGEIQTTFEQFVSVLSIAEVLNLESKTGL